MIAAVIPARGGSKRIPRKNVREFAGLPMIAYSINCAKRTGIFDRIVVSTDDDDIARIARDFGAETPFRRPPELSDDFTGTTEVIAHATAFLQSAGMALSAVCCIYATAPFVRHEDIVKGLETLEGGGWRYVFSATNFSYPIFRSFRKDAAGRLQMLFPEHFATRSQDLPEALHDAGQFYWGRPEAWLSGARIFDKHSTTVALPAWRVQDIDTLEDWIRAEHIMSLISKESPSC